MDSPPQMWMLKPLFTPLQIRQAPGLSSVARSGRRPGRQSGLPKDRSGNST